MNKFFLNADKKKAISWAIFDFGNSAYSTLILTFVFPIFYKEVIAKGTAADFYWGFITSISILIAGITAPFIGSMADYDKQRKKKMMIFTIISAIGTSTLYFTGIGTLLFASLVFIVSHIFFTLALFMYDSLLSIVSTTKTSGRISGLGYGLGYIGGIVSMILLRPFYANGYEGTLEPVYKLTFPFTALFFLLFSIPAFIFIKDKKARNSLNSFFQSMKPAMKNTITTLKEIKKHKQILLFLIAFFLMNDALVTVFAFISIYAKTTLLMGVSEIFIIFLIIQIVAFPAAVFLGLLNDKFGSKKVLLFALATWVLVIFLLAIAKPNAMSFYYLIALLTGLVIGGSQSVARAWFSHIIPRKKVSEFFGFNSFGSKIAAVLGPVLFGAISTATGNQRIAILSLIPFFLISFFIFLYVKDVKKK